MLLCRPCKLARPAARAWIQPAARGSARRHGKPAGCRPMYVCHLLLDALRDGLQLSGGRCSLHLLAHITMQGMHACMHAAGVGAAALHATASLAERPARRHACPCCRAGVCMRACMQARLRQDGVAQAFRRWLRAPLQEAPEVLYACRAGQGRHHATPHHITPRHCKKCAGHRAVLCHTALSTAQPYGSRRVREH